MFAAQPAQWNVVDESQVDLGNGKGSLQAARKAIIGYYNEFYQRDPSEVDLQNSLQMYEYHPEVSLEMIKAGIHNSAEYEKEQNEIASVRLKKENVERQPVKDNRAEAENVIIGYYHDLLGREPDDAGLQYWLRCYQQGVSFDEIKEGFLSSQEYRDKNRSRL